MKKLITIIAIIFTAITTFGQDVYGLKIITDNGVDVDTHTLNVTIGVFPSSNATVLNITTDHMLRYANYQGDTTDYSIYLYQTTTPDDTIQNIAVGNYTCIIKFQTTTTYSFLLNVFDSTTLSTDVYEFDRTDMIVFPSPAKQNTTVRFFADKQDVQVDVFSLNGSLVFSDNSTRMVGSLNDVEIDLSNFSAGVYIARAGTETFKFVKL